MRMKVMSVIINMMMRIKKMPRIQKEHGVDDDND